MQKSEEKRSIIHVYGPVPSRRLGFSLGVDILPLKTCSLDCIYCQLGPTSEKTVQRKEFYAQSDIISQIKGALSTGQRIDYITFSGSGEPTLNIHLEELIKEIKKITAIPVAVLTNSTLFPQKEVRRVLLEADQVIPSLDAVTQDTFEQLNRPHPSLHIDTIIESLKAFRQEFKGSLWLEVMLVKGINDLPSHIQKLKHVIAEIKPDKIQLNTVVRPPSEISALPLSSGELKKIRNVLGGNCEIIASFKDKDQIPSSAETGEAILTLIKRRPATLSDMASSLGRHTNELIKHLDLLLSEGKIKCVLHKGQKYYELSKKMRSQE